MSIAVITGATSGMGRALAKIIDRENQATTAFWLIGRREDQLRALKQELIKPARCFVMDLGEGEALIALQRELETADLKIGFLVNAAGFGMIGSIAELSAEVQMAMIDVNVRALTAITRLCLPYLSTGAHVVQFASAAAFLPQPNFAVYAASKSYVLSFSQALNAELPDASVTAVCPGPVRTAFFKTAEKVHRRAAFKNRFMADPKKVAEKAYRDAMAGRAVSVYGTAMKLLRLVAKLLPMRLLVWMQSPGKH
ncbi:SDR family NAD(P)-dependent oxidoreductase [Pseudoramibacter alactolyticus]|jgi:short-subunit dehydrogenase|uniref:SDR family NAD(P)-dependent oxidoreductase n=2 Tax=Pseudoramibacter alactolyticus TaxID=113287 RepID=UPI0028EE4B13|nr:SDR family NAD(P)-dependent oxidoreductase [Pseudoramibacter alactolyticus]